MEFDYYSPSETFVVLTADQFVGRDDGLEERAVLENLSKRKDLIVKAADKGGALVVWRADLY